MLDPLTTFVKLKRGTSEIFVFSVYCSVLIPPTFALALGLPNVVFALNALFSTAVICSNQFAFVVSFQFTVIFDRFTPVDEAFR